MGTGIGIRDQVQDYRIGDRGREDGMRDRLWRQGMDVRDMDGDRYMHARIRTRMHSHAHARRGTRSHIRTHTHTHTQARAPDPAAGPGQAKPDVA